MILQVATVKNMIVSLKVEISTLFIFFVNNFENSRISLENEIYQRDLRLRQKN